MKKTQMILLVLAGIISFASAFGTSWYVKQKKAKAAAEQTQAAAGAAATASAAAAVNAKAATELDFSVFGAAEAAQMGMTERQLQNLILDIRSKLKDYHDRQKELDTEAARIEISRQALQADIERLDALRDKLNLTMTDLQNKQQQLQQSVVEIDSLEKTNFQRLASTYEKMEVSQAGKIMVNMAASNQLQDSVKILYYMSDRSAGKLLAEIAGIRPELATLICSQLKRIKESE
jgi:chromosome segregation ATPase